MKINLYRHRINRQGYDAFGCYYGIGQPLYRYDCEAASGELRANSRADAKQKVIDALWTHNAIREENVEFYR